VSVASQFGYTLDKKNPNVREKAEKLFSELKEIEQKGYRTGIVGAEQYLLIEKYFGNLKEFFNIEKWKVETGMDNGKENSMFYVRCRINGDILESSLEIEGGPVDAAYKSIISLLARKYPEIKNLELEDFHVSIARSRKEESSVRTMITFKNIEEFQTVGVDNNIIQSAIEAMAKGFRYYLNKIYKQT